MSQKSVPRPFVVCLTGILSSGILVSGLLPGSAAGQDFDNAVPPDSFFDFDDGDSADSPADGGGQEGTAWNEMFSGSFGSPDESAPAETSLEIMPPTDMSNRLIDISSLPLATAFGNDPALTITWPTGKTWLTGQLPVSRTYNIRGCRFHLKTGPLSVAHFEKSGNEYLMTTDSLRPMTTLRPAAGGRDLYLAASADLYPEVDSSTLTACSGHLPGRIIPIGKFDLGGTILQLQRTAMTYTVEVADRSAAKPVQVYLYWPKDRSEPVLIDNSGLFPVLSSPVFRISADGKGSGLIEVIPHLSYTKGGKALTREKLLELWGGQ